MANGIEISNYRSLSRHAAGKKPSLQAMKPAIFILHFHENVNGFVTERDVIIILYGYNTIVHDLPRFLVNYVHAQTVDTRPLFRGKGGGGVWPGDEASSVGDRYVLGSCMIKLLTQHFCSKLCAFGLPSCLEILLSWLGRWIQDLSN